MAVRLLIFALRHRRQLWIAVALLLCASIGAAIKGNYTNDLAYMFPNNSISGNMYRVMQSSRLTQSIQLELDTGIFHGALPLQPKLEELAEDIRKQRNVASVDYRFTLESPDVMSSLIASLPLISDASILDNVSPKDAVMAIRKALALPGTPIADHRADPFGLRLPYLHHLETFRNLGGFNASTQYPFLTDTDAQRVLMLINADFQKAPSSGDIAALFFIIEYLVNKHLPDVTATIVSPLQHNLENERAVKRDILAVSLLSIIALIALVTIWFFFTEHQSSQSFDFIGIIVIPLMPVIASIIVTGILALCFHSLCLFVLGICGGIAGLAVDQGIHIYTAYAGRMRIRRLAGIQLPLALSVITSAASFLVLLATGIIAYRQMGLFAALTLILNLFLSFTLLPTILKPRRPVSIQIADFRPSKPLAVIISLLWLVITIAAVIAIPKLQFNLSLQSMDGSSAETFRQEEELQKRWRSQDAGTMMVVTADSHDGVLDACDQIMSFFPSGNDGDFSPSFLWPSTASRQRHLDTWTTPQATQHLQNLQQEIRDECQKAKLPPAFFDNFFKSINHTIATGISMPPPPLVQIIHKHLIHDYPKSSTALLFFRKCTDADTFKIVQYLLPEFPNAALLSADAFQLAVAQDIRPKLRKVVIIIIPILLLCLIPIIRSPLRLLLVFTPGLTAIIWGLGLAAVCGFKLNLVNLFSIVMLTGLVIDYGIFALHHARQPSSSIPTAMLLSALTTILTTGALLASKHPVMFSTGLVLSFGILLTATTALFVVPSLVQLLPFLKHKSVCLLLPLLLLFTSGCAMVSAEMDPMGNDALWFKKEVFEFQSIMNEPKKNAYKLTISIFWHDIPMLFAIKTDGNTGSLGAIATATNGVTLFSVSGSNFKEKKKFISDVFPDIAKKRVFNDLFDDLCNIFLPPNPYIEESSSFHRRGSKYGPVPAKAYYKGPPYHLILMKSGNFPRRNWRVEYKDWLPEKQAYKTIVYRNYHTHCKFTFTLLEPSSDKP